MEISVKALMSVITRLPDPERHYRGNDEISFIVCQDMPLNRIPGDACGIRQTRLTFRKNYRRQSEGIFGWSLILPD